MQVSSNSWKFTIVISLMVLSVIYRLFPHPYNFAPITGMALLAGSYLKSKKVFAILIPLIALYASDVILNNTLYRGFYDVQGIILFRPYMLATYFSLICIVLVGSSVNKLKFFHILGASLFSSILFFLVTNFSSWIEIPIYTKNLVGLTECFIAGLPFFPFTVLGDLVFSLTLFGIAALATRQFYRPQEVVKAS